MANLPSAQIPKDELCAVFSRLPSQILVNLDSSDPVYLFNHAMRTYIFGSLIGRTHGHRFDEETLYLACIFHDLGLTERFEGNLPFEIQGAEAARGFSRLMGYHKKEPR